MGLALGPARGERPRLGLAATTPGSVIVRIQHGGTAVSTDRKLNQNWQQITLRSVPVSAGGTVTSSLGTDVADTGDCVLVDDLSIFVD